MKNIKDLGENVAIQCKTQEEWDYLVETYGISCVRSRPDLKVHLLDPNSGTYTLDYVKRNDYTILQASDFMPLSPQDEIKELKERIATLEESLSPKKKIELLKLITETFRITNSVSDSCDYDNVELVCKYTNFDIIKAWDNGESPIIFLGNFNDGIK